MSIQVEATAVVDATPREVLEFVLDLRSYKEVDDKIVRVLGVKGPDANGVGSVSFLGSMPGLPLPPAPDSQTYLLDRWSSLQFTGKRRRPARLVFDFVGVVECIPNADGGTAVRHAYNLGFRGPFRRFEPRIESELSVHLEEEMQKLKRRLDGQECNQPRLD